MYSRARKLTLSTYLPYFLVSIPFILSFTTWVPLGFTGYEVPKAILFPILIGLALLLIFFTRTNILFSHRASIVLFSLWISWNIIASIANGTLASSFTGDIYFHFGLFQLLCLLLYLLLKPSGIDRFFTLLAVISGVIHSTVALLQWSPLTPRATSLLGEPNWLGGLVMISCITTVGLLCTKELKHYRIYLILALCLLCTGLLVSHSRSAFIGTVTGSFILFFALKRTIALWLCFILPVTVFGLLMGMGIQADTFAPLFEQTVFRGFSGTDSRLWIYEKGIALFLEKPFLGWGWEHIGTAFQTYIPTTRLGIEHLLIVRSHNLFLDLLITGGIPSLLLFGGFIGSLMFASWKRYTISHHLNDLLGVIIPFSIVLYGQFNPLSLVHWILLL